jgi:hypothetical protein
MSRDSFFLISSFKNLQEHYHSTVQTVEYSFVNTNFRTCIRSLESSRIQETKHGLSLHNNKKIAYYPITPFVFNISRLLLSAV